MMLSDGSPNTVLVLIACSFALIYFYVKYAYSYWERRGVPYLKPTFPFGNFGKNVRQQLSLGELLNEIYRSTTEPFIGTYAFLKPTLIARSPEFVRTILIKDFQYFMDHGVYVDEKGDPLSAHLFALEGDRWKNLRMKLTPTFTSGKMRAIFSTLVDGKTPLLRYLDKVAKSNETVEICELTACYTTNGIASVAFGIDVDCFADPNNPFRKYGRQFFANTLKNGFRIFCFNLCPRLLKWSGVRFIDRDLEEFMTDMVKQSLELREKNNIVRKDFFQLLVQLRNSGTVSLDDEFKTIISKENSKSLTIEEITAQAFVFYVAGFETSSSTMSFCLYEIAKNPEIQRKVQEEIDDVMAKFNGQLTYESVNEMKYLECCIDETLRKYCVVPILNRVCVKDYNIPGTKVTLKKGTSVLIPAYAIQRDEKFYPDPEKFDPLRFSSENKTGKSFLEMPYMPFGDGPRNCIGTRMGKLSTKVGIILMLQKYNVELDRQHFGKELEFKPGSNILSPKDGINLKFKTRTGYA